MHASGELIEAWRPRNNLAHMISSDFVAAEAEKFTGDVLNVAHAKTEAHQPGADGHQAAAHQAGQPAALARFRNCCFRTGNLVDQRLNAFGRTFITQETQDDADGLFSNSTIDAGV